MPLNPDQRKQIDDQLASLEMEAPSPRLVQHAPTASAGSTVDVDIGRSSTVIAYGANFVGTANGVCFDLNPDATAQLPVEQSGFPLAPSITRNTLQPQ